MNYWLSPTGKMWSTARMGGHYNLACEIIDEMDRRIRRDNHIENEIEHLENLGYIRFCDWGINPGWVIPLGYTPTRQQRHKIQIIEQEELT